MAFAASTPAFADGQTVPTQFTCEGGDEPPPIEVSDPPAGTLSFAIVMDDPDAPRGPFTHWLAYDIPADGTSLRTTAARTLENGFGRQGYGGPCPPPGHGPHRYYFTVYALDIAALAIRGRTRAAFEAAVQPHTLATARFMGRYERTQH